MPEQTTNNQSPTISDTGTGERVIAPRDTPQIEGYQIIDRLGEGGMGTVWRGVQLSTKREVALKLIGAAFIASEKVRRRSCLLGSHLLRSSGLNSPPNSCVSLSKMLDAWVSRRSILFVAMRRLLPNWINSRTYTCTTPFPLASWSA